MNIFIYILSGCIIVLGIFYTYYGCKELNEKNLSKEEQLRAHIRKNRNIFGVNDSQHHSNNNDDVILVSPQQMGL